ncbi:MAG: hypothetical protein RBT30_03700 [Patescibacteria group bacterium]|jgi:hypothetical protein|nr:hypothetical protein [Patescibacteria group bacterium]
MSDKDFLSQLKTLKEIHPQSDWLKSNREILLSQISNSGADNISSWQKILIDIKSFSLVVSKPVMAMASFLVLFVATSAFAHLAFNQTKPSDSLYIARIISEKAKLSTVFNAQEREKLEAKFAANHVETITNVLAESNVTDDNEDQFAYLNDSFNKEINIVREKIVGIAKRNEQNVTSPVTQTLVSEELEEDALVSVADNSKEEQGTQLEIKTVVNVNTEETKEAPVETATDDKTAELATEDDTSKQEAEAALANALDEVKDPEALIAEVQALFEARNYQGALEKIREVKAMIE